MKQSKKDVFISYSRKDYCDEHENVIPGNEVSRIKEALDAAGITYWFDKKDITAGEDYGAKILKHIKASDVLVYLSSSSANNSKWTRREIACADDDEKFIVPVLLDNTPYYDSVKIRIVDIDRIDYYQNPKEGIRRLVDTVKSYLAELKANSENALIDDRRRQEDLEQQRKLLQAEKQKRKVLDDVEMEIAAEEKRMAEQEKTLQIKEQELKKAQQDLRETKDCLARLREKLNKLQMPNKPVKSDNSVVVGQNEEGLFTIKGVSFKMVRVVGGKFQMGADENDKEAHDDERPKHEVALADFSIGETVVTQELWKAVMGENPSRIKGKDLPVDSVCWDDPNHQEWSCQVFIQRLNDLVAGQLPHGKKFRLPSEAEWEFAARGGNNRKRKTYSGSDVASEVAWYADNSGQKPHSVKEGKRPNELGIYGMSGNVWEFCSDWYGEDFYQKSPMDNPTGPLKCYGRVYRGGSWKSDMRECRVSYRNYGFPTIRLDNLGFRLAL